MFVHALENAWPWAVACPAGRVHDSQRGRRCPGDGRHPGPQGRHQHGRSRWKAERSATASEWPSAASSRHGPAESPSASSTRVADALQGVDGRDDPQTDGSYRFSIKPTRSGSYRTLVKGVATPPPHAVSPWSPVSRAARGGTCSGHGPYGSGPLAPPPARQALRLEVRSRGGWKHGRPHPNAGGGRFRASFKPRKTGRLPPAGALCRRRIGGRNQPQAEAGLRLPGIARLVVRPGPLRQRHGVWRHAPRRPPGRGAQVPALRHAGHVPLPRTLRDGAGDRPRALRRRPRVGPDRGHQAAAGLRRLGVVWSTAANASRISVPRVGAARGATLEHAPYSDSRSCSSAAAPRRRARRGRPRSRRADAPGAAGSRPRSRSSVTPRDRLRARSWPRRPCAPGCGWRSHPVAP